MIIFTYRIILLVICLMILKRKTNTVKLLKQLYLVANCSVCAMEIFFLPEMYSSISGQFWLIIPVSISRFLLNISYKIVEKNSLKAQEKYKE